MGLRETESLWVVILHTEGSLSAQEKAVILFGKALKGKINEYSEWMQGTETGVENSFRWNELLISAEKEFPKHDKIVHVLPAFNHLDISNCKSL